MATPVPGTPEYDEMIHQMLLESTQASGVPYFVEDPIMTDKIVSVFAAAAMPGQPAVGHIPNKTRFAPTAPSE